MTNRSDGHDDELVRALDELFADDVFLTELSRGVDVSDGEDPLADLFLALQTMEIGRASCRERV